MQIAISLLQTNLYLSLVNRSQARLACSQTSRIDIAKVSCDSLSLCKVLHVKICLLVYKDMMTELC